MIIDIGPRLFGLVVAVGCVVALVAMGIVIVALRKRQRAHAAFLARHDSMRSRHSRQFKLPPERGAPEKADTDFPAPDRSRANGR